MNLELRICTMETKHPTPTARPKAIKQNRNTTARPKAIKQNRTTTARPTGNQAEQEHHSHTNRQSSRTGPPQPDQQAIKQNRNTTARPKAIKQNRNTTATPTGNQAEQEHHSHTNRQSSRTGTPQPHQQAIKQNRNTTATPTGNQAEQEHHSHTNRQSSRTGTPQPHQQAIKQNRNTMTGKRRAQSREAMGSLFVGCLTSQQHASVSQGRICSDKFYVLSH